jgi:hypothetical protein
VTSVSLDDIPVTGREIPLADDGREHRITACWARSWSPRSGESGAIWRLQEARIYDSNR